MRRRGRALKRRGGLLRVSPTSGAVVIADGTREWDLKPMSPRYWASGSSAQAYRSALRLQKLVGRQVVANIEYHNAFGWVISGSSNIRLEK